MSKPNQDIKHKIKSLVENQSIVLPSDEDYYLNYLLGNNFVDNAAHYLIESIGKYENVVRKESRELTEIIAYVDELIRIEKAIQNQPQLTEDEVIFIVLEFLQSHQIHGEPDVDSIALRKNYFNRKDDTWTVNVTLSPPSSMENRMVEVAVSKRTRAVTLMVSPRDPKEIN